MIGHSIPAAFDTATFGMRMYAHPRTVLLLLPQAVVLQDGQRVAYDQLCICNGAKPKVVLVLLVWELALRQEQLTSQKCRAHCRLLTFSSACAQKILQHPNVIALRDHDSVQVILDEWPHAAVPVSSLNPKRCIVPCSKGTPARSRCCGAQDMRQRLESARKVMVVGNGGIALELV